ncbi:hypothetical protein ACFLS1_04625 [Verrucomicrobiota bacterium]
MKNIDDKMVEKALKNLKGIRKLRPCLVILGAILLALAAFLGRYVYLFSQLPLSENSAGFVVLRLVVPTIHVAFLVFMGVFLLCSGLMRNNIHIILEHLAEHYLKEKKEP